MKVCFITHTTDVGGAAVSFLTAMNDLIADRRIKPEDHLLLYPYDNHSDAYVELKRVMPNCKTLLPFGWIFKGAAPGLHRKLYRMFMEAGADWHFIGTGVDVLIEHNIDTVYLNSIVLWSLLPLIPTKMKKIIHVRESFDDSLESSIAIKVIKKYADVVIAIDKNVARPFADIAYKTRIVQNPVDMTRARELRENKTLLRQRFEIPEHAFVVTLVGTVGKQKGHDFLIESLEFIRRHKNNYSLTSTVFTNILNNVTFVLSGDVDDKRMLEKLKSFSNVKYTGIEWDISKIYAMSNLVIRCEDYLPIGRTVWEGLYAGVPVLIPIRPEDKPDAISEYQGKQIFTYAARNTDEFLGAIVDFVSNNYLTYQPFEECKNIRESAGGLYEALSSKGTSSTSGKPTLKYDQRDRTVL